MATSLKGSIAGDESTLSTHNFQSLSVKADIRKCNTQIGSRLLSIADLYRGRV
ncbi:MAG: hypothetical protein WCD07_02790 [Burkholderiales bacterium]